MRVSLLIARSRLRRNVGATIALIVLAGIGGGVVIASLASIRRADQGWHELQAENTAADAVATVLTEDGAFPGLVDDDLASVKAEVDALPVTRRSMRSAPVVAEVTSAAHPEPELLVADLSLDPPIASVVGSPIVVEGRLADPRRADETTVNEAMARSLGVRVGSVLTVRPLLARQLDEIELDTFTGAEGSPSEVRVVGVTRAPGDLPVARGTQQAFDNSTFSLGPAWYEANGSDLATYGVSMGIELRRPDDIGVVGDALAARHGDQALVMGGEEFELGVGDGIRASVESRLRAEGRAQLLFAAVAALIAILILGQTLVRQLGAEATDTPALEALGLTRGDRARAAVLRSLTIAAGAAVTAAVVAIGLSALLPRGMGARVRPPEGVYLDPWVVVLGALAVAAVVLGVATVGAWRAGVPRRPPPARSVAIADRLAAVGVGLTPTVGFRLAFDRSRAGLTGRVAVAAGACAVATVVAAGGLLASFDGLVARPERLGQRWDLSVGNFSQVEAAADGARRLEATDGVRAVAGEVTSAATVGGEPALMVIYQPMVGEIEPTVAAGRAPVAADEVMLGETVARDQGLEIGDQVPITVEFIDGERPYTVVGLGVVGSGAEDPNPGRTALLSSRLLEDADLEVVSQNLLVQADPGTDLDAMAVALEDDFPDTLVRAPLLPRAVSLYDDLSYAPVALAVVVSVLAAVAIVNALVTSTRRRRADLAVLKALGAGGGQLQRMVAWQSTAWASLSVVIGVPVGLVVAAAGWEAITDSLGLRSATELPATAVALVALVVIATANGLALLTGRAATRVRAAEALRIE